ncbi:MAG: serine/threonine protein kinase [Alphaproteobacteria bacterium]|nr:serine/threonine protein kinase [Alphaproteobacteria bacterium]
MLAGRYQIQRLIARGGMGSVYEAVQEPLGRRVALKVLAQPPNASDAEAFANRFLLEASSLARLSHPHTVTLHDYGQTQDGIYFLVMEYVDGQPLSRLLQSHGPLPPERTIRLMLQVARAVNNAHRHGVIHRDLKPSNLLVTTNTEGEDLVKVVDFGLAKLTEGDQSITVTGMILGSPHCMAPEQVQGVEVDERTDIYALGVLMFRTLTGQYPFHGSTTTATMIAHIQNPIPRLAEVSPDLVIPDGLEDVMRKALAKDPQNRYQDMGTLIKDLVALGAIPAQEFTHVSTIMLPKARRRTLLPVVAFGGVLLGLLGVLVLSFSTTPSGTDAAAVVDGPHEVRVTIRSTPEGATVRMGERVLGTTPLDVNLSSEGDADPRTFDISLDGHTPVQAERDLAGRSALDLDVVLAPVVAEPVEEPPPDPLPVERAPPRQTTPEKTSKAGPTKETQPEKPPAKATQEAPPPKESEESPPAGYKSNPFD